MAKTLKLLQIEVHTDSDTGLYDVGELDFGVPSDPDVHYWIKVRRQQIADFLRDLAHRCEQGKAPFKAHFAPRRAERVRMLKRRRDRAVEEGGEGGE